MISIPRWMPCQKLKKCSCVVRSFFTGLDSFDLVAHQRLAKQIWHFSGSVSKTTKVEICGIV